MNSVRCKFNNPPMTISLICPQYLPVCNPPPFLSNCMRFLSFCQRDFVVKTVSFFFFSFLMFFSFQSPLISPNWKKEKWRWMDGTFIYRQTSGAAAAASPEFGGAERAMCCTLYTLCVIRIKLTDYTHISMEAGTLNIFILHQKKREITKK